MDRKRPIGIDALLAKRRLEEAKSAKPVFLTKAQREALRNGSSIAAATIDTASENHKNSSSNASDNQTQKRVRESDHLTEDERRAIKQRYMGNNVSIYDPDTTDGVSNKSRERAKEKDIKKRLVFEWDAEEDTSQQAQQPLYQPTRVMFGRGKLAGMDDDLALPRSKRSKWDSLNWKEKPLEHMSERDWRIFREDFNITTKGKNIPKPIRYWKEAPIARRIKEVLDRVGYRDPTPIQRQAIPIGLQNRDMIGIAETGSGKTAAFLIPMLEFILKLPRMDSKRAHDGPYAIVLVPTRELAQQIEKETLKFAKPLGLQCISIVGGHSVEEQGLRLQNGIEIVIATPGRLRDIIERRLLVLNQCTYIVMDEADRMVEMGFEEDVNYILGSLPVTSRKPDSDEAMDSSKMFDRRGVPQYRQTTMFSATMPPIVERIAKQYLSRPAIVTIGRVGQAVDKIKQLAEFVPNDRKMDRLLSILTERTYQPPIIVFVNMKTEAEVLGRQLEHEKWRVAILHGGKSQDQREMALNSLRRGDKHILVATDVASRGLDVPDVSLVVNYDMAKSIEDYTHRIGRTGRAGKSGTALSFLTDTDAPVLFDLKKMLQKSGNAVPRELATHEAAQFRPGQLGGAGDDLEQAEEEFVPEGSTDITQQSWY